MAPGVLVFAALLALGATYYHPALAPVKEEAKGTHAQTIRS